MIIDNISQGLIANNRWAGELTTIVNTHLSNLSEHPHVARWSPNESNYGKLESFTHNPASTPMTHQQSNHANTTLKPDALEQQLIQALQPPFQNIWFTGGEPLLQIEALKKMVDLCPKHARITLDTTGTLTPFLSEIIDNLDRISLTLHPEHLNDAFDCIQYIMTKKPVEHLSINCHVFSSSKPRVLAQVFQHLSDISPHLHVTLLFHVKRPNQHLHQAFEPFLPLAKLAGKKIAQTLCLPYL